MQGKTRSAPSAGFEPATPGLGNLLCIRASEHPKSPMNIGFSRSLGLARSGAQFRFAPPCRNATRATNVASEAGKPMSETIVVNRPTLATDQHQPDRDSAIGETYFRLSDGGFEKGSATGTMVRSR